MLLALLQILHLKTK